MADTFLNSEGKVSNNEAQSNSTLIFRDSSISATGLMRMAIFTYKKEDYKDPGDPKQFVVMFNPNAYTSKYEIEYKVEQQKGNTKGSPKFGSIKPRDLSFEFILDGTGVANAVEGRRGKVDIHATLEEFKKCCIYSRSDTHRPHFLELLWGDLSVRVILKSADISFSMFDLNGYPLRAKIVAVFTEGIADSLREKEEKKNSPDLTHVRPVGSESRLPIMVYKEYNDHAAYYLSVARANKLDHFRSLKTGSKVIMPPVRDEQL